MSVKDNLLNFDLEKLTNPYVPPNQLKHLPKWISHWLGYRSEEHKDPPALICYLSGYIGTIAGLLIAGAIYTYAPGITQYNPPALIASLGATAVLQYSAINTPLSQPKNAVVGQAFSAIIGVAISKGFQVYSNFDQLQWIAGAVACATAILAMEVTSTLHPPGGATAILTCVSQPVIAMGWYYVPVLLIGVLVMIGVALISNNIVRQWPLWWWSGEEIGSKLKRSKQRDEEKGENEEKKNDEQEEQADEDNRSDTTLHQQISNMSYDSEVKSIHIVRHHLTVPADLHISEAEMAVLQKLQSRLAEAK